MELTLSEFSWGFEMRSRSIGNAKSTKLLKLFLNIFITSSRKNHSQTKRQRRRAFVDQQRTGTDSSLSLASKVQGIFFNQFAGNTCIFFAINMNSREKLSQFLAYLHHFLLLHQ
jgi:hypothetical protein